MAAALQGWLAAPGPRRPEAVGACTGWPSSGHDGWAGAKTVSAGTPFTRVPAANGAIQHLHSRRSCGVLTFRYARRWEGPREGVSRNCGDGDMVPEGCSGSDQVYGVSGDLVTS